MLGAGGTSAPEPRGLGAATGLFLLLLTGLSACAGGPSVGTMDAAAIQAVADKRLCSVQANLLGEGRRVPTVDTEVGRRGLDCSAWIGAAVSDCSTLAITNAQRNDEREGIIFTVVNNGPVAKNYRIYHVGIQSSRQEIQPGETQQVGMAFNPGAMLLGQATSGAGKAESMLNECLNTYYSIPAQPPRRATAATTAAAGVPIGAGEQTGRQTRATANVNMRAGPGTNHAALGTLRPGDEVTVVSVQGTWCECMGAGKPRFFASCRYLSAPAGGWPSLAQSAGANGNGGKLSQNGLGPVRVGMTVLQVARSLGGPLSRRDQFDSSECENRQPLRGYPGLSFLFLNGKLDSVSIWGEGRQATEQGIGIGSTATDVRRAYPSIIERPHEFGSQEAINLIVASGENSGILFEVEGESGRVRQIRAGGPSIFYYEGCA